MLAELRLRLSTEVDEHVRFAQLTDLLGAAPVEGDAELVLVVLAEPDPNVRDALLGARLEDVASETTSDGMRAWVESRIPVRQRSRWLADRIRDWGVIKWDESGAAVDEEVYVDGSYWLQRRLAASSQSADVLANLTSKGRTKRVRRVAEQALKVLLGAEGILAVREDPRPGGG